VGVLLGMEPQGVSAHCFGRVLVVVVVLGGPIGQCLSSAVHPWPPEAALPLQHRWQLLLPIVQWLVFDFNHLQDVVVILMSLEQILLPQRPRPLRLYPRRWPRHLRLSLGALQLRLGPWKR